MSRAKILLVEDDANLAFVIKDNLEAKGYEVNLFNDGESAWKAIHKERYDICILDVMLPKKDGFTLARNIRKDDPHIPIIFLTAKGMKEDKIEGFRAGADDYITKPFSIEELGMRIEVFLRRTKNLSPLQDLFQISSYTFDFENLTLTGKTKINLTQKEADVLKLFCQHKGTLLKREDILKKIWGDDDYFMGRSLDVFITKIRKYLKEDKNIEIQNVHGVGFKFLIKQ
jgi:DNA-binding response OmpR family regulator